MATTADFRNGLCINHNGEPWKIESFLHVKPGKGPAFVRTKIRNLNTGRLLENTFTSGVKIDVIRIENRKYQYLYSEGNDYHLMNNDDYEQNGGTWFAESGMLTMSADGDDTSFELDYVLSNESNTLTMTQYIDAFNEDEDGNWSNSAVVVINLNRSE